MLFGKLLVIVCSVVAIMAFAGTMGSEITVGTATVLDGDTIEVSGTRIRIFGIDAPESQQLCITDGKMWPCGKKSTEALKAYLGDSALACRPRGNKGSSYGRKILACFKGTEDIGQRQVRDGWAIAYRRYGADYVPDEDAARREYRGLWASMFMPPELWRRQYPEAHLHPDQMHLN